MVINLESLPSCVQQSVKKNPQRNVKKQTLQKHPILYYLDFLLTGLGPTGCLEPPPNIVLAKD